MRTNKSPGIPLGLLESFPFADTLSCIPSSTPGGILIETVSSELSIPLESVPGPLLIIVCPDPPQAGQIDEDCILPRIVFVTLVTWPVPLHVVHVENLESGERIFLLTLSLIHI